MTQSISKTYLTGWEYNRLLQAEPWQPRISALPAAVFWQGAHQFWMFRAVLCTAESIENECAAADSLGWATGAIIGDLVAEGIVESVDWPGLPFHVRERLRATRNQLVKEYPEHRVRDLIETRNVAELEIIKNQLLQPVLSHHGAMASGAPNSLTNWAGGRGPGSMSSTDKIAVLLSKLAAPLLPGLHACRPPGTGLPADVVQRQKDVQDTVEQPLITQLMAGDAEFGGARGYLPYFEALSTHTDAYRPINEQILADWSSNRTRLLRLRDVAAKHLWPSLHAEWLPALTSGAMTGAAFEQLISRAIRRSAFDRFFDSRPIRTVIGSVPAAVGVAVTASGVAIATAAGLDATQSAGASAGAAAAAEVVRQRLSALASQRREDKPLAVFYQQANRTIATT